MSDHEKTEQPTPRRQEKARKEGRFVASKELVAAAQFLTFLSLLSGYSSDWLPAAKALFRALLSSAFEPDWGAASVSLHLWQIGRELAFPLLTGGALVLLAPLAVQMVTTRFGFATNRLAPDLTRLNPAGKLRGLPSQNMGNLVVALGVLPLFGLGLWWIWTERAPWLARLPWMGLGSGTKLVAATVEDILWKAAFLFVGVGLWDWWRQRQRWNSEMKMSKQEIREEMKESDGNPQSKQRIRRMMREFSRRRMMSDVETATAVIVNPTHYAVALRYVAAEMPAPKVVAKGRNYLALRIRERAMRHQVPIVENPPLAQALYKSAHVGQEIPAPLFRAVAEVLAYIYRLMNARPNAKPGPQAGGRTRPDAGSGGGVRTD
ncbi:MAG: EscU/YscU/HrcU family type III secretion system export apparatus switch protein [Bryobacteraceae bacterium]